MILFIIFGLFNCGVEINPSGPSGADCKKIEGLPGPEDLAIDREEKFYIFQATKEELKTKPEKFLESI